MAITLFRSAREAGSRSFRGALPTCLVAAILASACGGNGGTTSGSTSTPTTPTTPAPPATNPNQWSIDGRVVQTLASAGVAGATITFPGGIGTATTDGSGSFRFESTTIPALSPYYLVTISAPGYVTRTAALNWAKSSTVTLDVIADRAPFSLGFYRNLVRNNFDSPGNLQPLRRWVDVPKFYMRTEDTAGRAIEPEVRSLVQEWLRRGMSAWTGGRWAIGTFEAGAADRANADGWIVVEYVRDQSANYCGRSFVGSNPGRITFNDDRCACGSIKVPPGVVVHELGHALGFYHVPQGTGVMGPQFPGTCPGTDPVAAEQYHAQIAYQRPRLNTDIDSDSDRIAPFPPAALVVN